MTFTLTDSAGLQLFTDEQTASPYGWISFGGWDFGAYVGSTTVEESAGAVTYDTWSGVSSANASGGRYRVTPSTGSTAVFTFVGGTDLGVVDLYAPTTHWQTVKTYSALSFGTHTLTIRVLGTKNAAASSTKVAVDAFVVR